MKVGDKVKIKKDLKVGWQFWRIPYRGKVATIIGHMAGDYFINTLDIDDGWNPWPDDYLIKIPTKVYKFKLLKGENYMAARKAGLPEKEMLNEKEKKYLSAVIKPFKERIIGIELVENHGVLDTAIFIRLENDEYISLPHFKPGTMYKNMPIGIEYTLEELGLE